MRTGTILFVTEGRDDLHDHSDPLRRVREQLGVNAVLLAVSEDEVAYAWWRMLVKGMHHISLMRAAYQRGKDILELRGAALRLYG